MIKILLLWISLLSVAFANISEYRIKEKALPIEENKIRILDVKELKFKSFNTFEVSELSALAYRDNTLFALNDKGTLFHFKIKIHNKKIKELTLSQAYPLKNKEDKVLKKSKRDSEGLSFIGKDLLISFERKPRVEVFSSVGIKLKKKKINKDIRDIKNYRSKNKALESVAYNEKYGVITAPEKSLEGLDIKQHTLYSKTKKWEFPASGSITALEFMSQNKIMILQRKFNSFSRRRVTTISMLHLKSLEYEVLARLDTKDGWSLDNFEGLTKIDKNHYLMVSDDNDSFFQKTLLVLFEVF